MPAPPILTLTAEMREVNERLLLASLRAQASSEASEEERAQLRALLDAMQEGVFIADGAGVVTMVNRAARRLMRMDATESVDLATALSLDVRRLDMSVMAAAERPLTRALGGETFADVEVFLVRGEGDIRRVQASATSTKEGGALKLAILIYRDVTERHRLEERLRQAERLAAASTLTAGLAHEINNPLASVLANIELVRNEVRLLGPCAPSERLLVELEEMLEDARLGAERIRDVVAKLQGFCPRTEARRAGVDVRPIVDRAVRMASNEVRYRAELGRQDGAVPLVDVDEARLGEVVFNLLIDAVHGLPERSAADNEIRIVTATDAAGQAVIEVRDNRPAIAPELLSRIFDPFVTTTSVSGGSAAGLRLSLCYSLVRAMGGEISVTSSRETGTAFRVVLPPSVLAVPSSCSPIVGAERDALTARRGTVLVVDDEPSIGVTLRRVLALHDVTVLSSAADALALLATGKQFDVILSDLMMPGKSGMEFHDELARTSPDDARRIVFVSGGACTPGSSAFLARVPNERLEKPFEAGTVRALVQRLVDARPARETR